MTPFDAGRIGIRVAGRPANYYIIEEVAGCSRRAGVITIITVEAFGIYTIVL